MTATARARWHLDPLVTLNLLIAIGVIIALAVLARQDRHITVDRETAAKVSVIDSRLEEVEADLRSISVDVGQNRRMIVGDDE